MKKIRIDSTLSVRLPSWLIEVLEEEAEQNGRSVSNLVRFILMQHFKKAGSLPSASARRASRSAA